MLTAAAPVAALLLVLTVPTAVEQPSATGLPVRIARLGPCGGRTVVLEVLPQRGFKLCDENLPPEALGGGLQEIFRNELYRYVFVIGDPSAEFGDVAEIIDIASAHVDHIALVTPSVGEVARHWENGSCSDPNLPREYLLDPGR